MFLIRKKGGGRRGFESCFEALLLVGGVEVDQLCELVDFFVARNFDCPHYCRLISMLQVGVERSESDIDSEGCVKENG